MVTSFLFLGFWLALVLIGAKILVDKLTRVAESIGIPPLVLSLTVIALGTSLPELVVSLGAARAGSPGIALGNVIGSNIANILLVLGVCALIRPLPVASQTIKLDAPVMLGVSGLLVLLTLDGALSGIDSWLLLAAAVVYTAMLLRVLKKDGAQEKKEEERVPTGRVLLWTFTGLAGGAVMMFASEYVVEYAKSIALSLGMSEAMVGTTIVAIGTSLPELVSSGYAAWKNRADMAIGGLVGSNICNVVIVAGLTGVVASGGIPVESRVTLYDMWFMVAVAVLGFWFARTAHRVSRFEGGVFLALYAAFLVFKVTSL